MRALVLDTETTALIDNHTLPLDKLPEVIEFVGILVDLKTAKVLDLQETLVKPKKKVSAEVTAITTITNEMLAKAPTFAHVADSIAATIESAPLIIAHNASYDKEVLDIEFERMGRKIKWPRVICTVEQTIHLKGFRLGLSALHELLFGEKFEGAHRARVDVEALVRCCVELVRRDIL